MPNTGKFLEDFVSRIENLLIPKGFTVTTNEKIYNGDGVQIAEFDIEISGKVGTTNFKWLIECRDRPTQGPAPGSWIEQLVGRRERFNFDKVIAVSTTDFSEGASQFAKDKGIEIRNVTEASLDQISDWFLVNEILLFKKGGVLEKAMLVIYESTVEKEAALRKVLADNKPDAKILRSTESNQYMSVAAAFMNAAVRNVELYDDIIQEGGTKNVALRVDYTNENSHFVVESKIGDIRIKEILFEGKLTVAVEKIPVLKIRRYESFISGEVIATSASFTLEIDGISRELSFNKIQETGEISVVVSAPQKPA